MRPSLSPDTWAWLVPSSAGQAAPINVLVAGSRLEHRLAESAEAARRDLLDLVPEADANAIDEALARARGLFERGDRVAMYDIADAILGVDDPHPEVRGHARALVRQWAVLTSLSATAGSEEDLRVVRGRREVAERARPPITRAIESVLGGDARSIGEIMTALEARAWLPRAANPRAYISQILASRKDRFRRVRRGTYARCS